jgi:hypothetical protein
MSRQTNPVSVTIRSLQQNNARPSNSYSGSRHLITFRTSKLTLLCWEGKPAGLVVTQTSRHVCAAHYTRASRYCAFWAVSAFSSGTTHTQTPWPLVRKGNIPTKRPPLVGEIYYQILRIEGCRVVSVADPPRSLISVF